MRHLEKGREEDKQSRIMCVKKTVLGELASDVTSPVLLFHPRVAELLTKFAVTANLSAVAPSYSPGLCFLQAAPSPPVGR